MPEPKALYALLAPCGQLSGNGQLRETVSERRKKKGDDVSFWYLSPSLVKKFDLPGTNVEAVIADEITAINWLKLRFGGNRITVKIDVDQLRIFANDLPPGPNDRDLSC